MTPPSISAIGKPMQIAFVPDDFDAALIHWTQAMGVGPFFVMQNIVLEDGRFMGAPSDCKFTIALAQWGDVQIELIRQENDVPSIYRGDYRPPSGAMHHVCVLTDDIAGARDAIEAGGGQVLVEGKVGANGAVIYADCGPAGTRPNAGAIIEVLQPASGSEGFFAMVAEAAKGWDGSDPVRLVG
ncbi:VOC family protein [Blastomonas aquatica]|uniref:Glyoxalase n=1 Tax=Blastomonas aquatica TaxID=1510276 RepID=A0ABQ1IX82_9SPHN|nr:VOC family protein [Blastomonas aquatica]GGB53411.1 glyoxalase [Blastomonas aquatica]